MYYNTIQVVSRSEKRNGKMKRTAIYLTPVKLCIQLPPEKQNVKLLHLVDFKKKMSKQQRDLIILTSDMSIKSSLHEK